VKVFERLKESFILAFEQTDSRGTEHQHLTHEVTDCYSYLKWMNKPRFNTS